MAIFTQLDKENLSDVIEIFGGINEFKPVSGGTDNSVYYFKTKKDGEFIYKLYEGKQNRFFIRLLAIHNRINEILTHKPILKTIDQVSGKVAIIFNFIINETEHDLNKIIPCIDVFHLSLNKGKYSIVKDKSCFLDEMNIEVLHFKKNITKTGYITKYQDFNLDILLDQYNQSLNYVSNNKEDLLIGYIHGDLNIGNIINTSSGPEFIDFDGVNKNFILKDYIILIIRFNLFDKLDYFFEKIDNNNYIIGNEKVSYLLIRDLYKLYSIYLILNMIYYIGYDQKPVIDDMYGGDNQSWQEIYKNLIYNKII